MKLSVILIILFLVGCTRSVKGPEITLPTTSALVSSTAGPTETIVTVDATGTMVGTKTFEPTSIPQTPTELKGTPPSTPTTSLPEDKPLKSWREITIMTGAITGEELADRYRFLIGASVEEVGDYYKKELPKFGWKFVTSGTGENGAPIFIFSKGKSMLSVSVIVLGKMAVVTLALI
jgi:hypothetical protein